MKKFVPLFCEEFDGTDYSVNCLEDVFENEFVKKFSDNPDFKKFDIFENVLMAVCEWKCEKGTHMFVSKLGSLIGFSEKEYEEFGLKNYTELIERN